ncbi:MAG: hypothetical protein LBP50_00340, partial [Tannerella sp.]|nr:hypothetical protein [Tannerella sp.]
MADSTLRGMILCKINTAGVVLSITPHKRSAVRGYAMREEFNTEGVALSISAKGQPATGLQALYIV